MAIKAANIITYSPAPPFHIMISYMNLEVVSCQPPPCPPPPKNEFVNCIMVTTIKWYNVNYLPTFFLGLGGRRKRHLNRPKKKKGKKIYKVQHLSWFNTEAPQETPHITPTAISVVTLPRRDTLSVTVGEVNNIRLDVSVDFDPSDTDDVSGTNNWRIIVWFSNEGNGVSGSRIAETEDTLTTQQKNQPLTAPGPLRFQVLKKHLINQRTKPRKEQIKFHLTLWA